MFTFTKKVNIFLPSYSEDKSKMKAKTDYEQACQLLDLVPCVSYSDNPCASKQIKDTAHNLQPLPAELAVIRDEALVIPSESQDWWDFLLLQQTPINVSQTQVSDPLS